VPTIATNATHSSSTPHRRPARRTHADEPTCQVPDDGEQAERDDEQIPDHFTPQAMPSAKRLPSARGAANAGPDAGAEGAQGCVVVAELQHLRGRRPRVRSQSRSRQPSDEHQSMSVLSSSAVRDNVIAMPSSRAGSPRCADQGGAGEPPPMRTVKAAPQRADHRHGDAPAEAREAEEYSPMAIVHCPPAGGR
jgi:hypothetical protein